jgi:predicted RNA binding protein YcfA (HicA-like mRNA interferase family)
MRFLEGLGFVLVRTGKHHVLQHPDGRWTSLPSHPGDLSPNVTRNVLRTAGVPPDRFFCVTAPKDPRCHSLVNSVLSGGDVHRLFESGDQGEEEIIGWVGDYLGRKPAWRNLKYIGHNEWREKVCPSGEPSECAASVTTMNGDIWIKNGYESDILHEMIHAAGFTPTGVKPFLNEALTQTVAEDIAELHDYEIRKTYQGGTSFIRDRLLPALGIPLKELAGKYAAAENKSHYLAQAVIDAAARTGDHYPRSIARIIASTDSPKGEFGNVLGNYIR